ncbi:MAG: methyltransferase domain-containing protein [Proteobacteria bacterium]|nr:methyltransferase domain-containing protein [Pseudomonadota bacterium]
MCDDGGIESIGLYTNLDRVARGLASLGIASSDPIAPEQLFPFDQWHYHGTAALAEAARSLALGAQSRVLEIGSGIGGPARYLAHTVGCHVCALELQPKVHDIARDLTHRCGLDERVTHLCGDALSYPLPPAEYDAVVSWLAVLHIPDRPRLLRQIAGSLRPGGAFFVEDFVAQRAFGEPEQRDLREIVYAVSVTRVEEYTADLHAAGFVRVAATDMTEEWTAFVTQRLTAWRANRETYTRDHTEAAYAAQETFYAAVARLFEGGSLGGVRLVAYAP